MQPAARCTNDGATIWLRHIDDHSADQLIMSESTRTQPEPAPQIAEEALHLSVLAAVRDEARKDPECPVRAWGLAAMLNVPQHVLFRTVESLARHGLVDYHGAGPLVSITPLGLSYLRGGFDEGGSPDA